jgi:hypothetical protein
MTDPRTVWLVASGEWSDYTVWCAFETEALAQEYVASFGAIAVGRHRSIVDSDGNYLDERLRVERLQLWSSVPVVSVRDDDEIDPGIDRMEEPEPEVPYVPDPPPPTPEEFGAKVEAWVEQHNARLADRSHVS